MTFWGKLECFSRFRIFETSIDNELCSGLSSNCLTKENVNKLDQEWPINVIEELFESICVRQGGWFFNYDNVSVT